MQVTFESTEPVEQVMAVLSALYRVSLTTAPAAEESAAAAPTPATSTRTAAARKTSSPERAAKAGTAGRSRRTGRASAAPVDAAAVRAWARDHGITVNARGALPATVLTAYTAANG